MMCVEEGPDEWSPQYIDLGILQLLLVSNKRVRPEYTSAETHYEPITVYNVPVLQNYYGTI